jgi:hypothetical protein
MKEQQRQVYRTARGREIDMGKFTLQNELTPAVGNARVNARGDKLGPGGKIIKQKEQLQPGATPVPNQVSKKDVSDMDPEGNE